MPGPTNDNLSKALLPQGLRDLLPPDAAAEAAAVGRLIAVLSSHGYQRVKPPLMEFEENLLSGAGAAMAPETFRLMDPISQRMIGLRADMTTQVARIAAARLANAARPLRLCYAGQVLRVKGSDMRPERQIGQVGAELIGSDAIAADVEVVILAAEALSILGIEGLSVDLTLPTLVPAICRAAGIAGTSLDALRRALDHKDSAAVAASGGKAASLLQRLLAAAGAAEPALKAIAALDLLPEAAAERARLAAVASGLASAVPKLAITIDPVENRGFEYHTGVSFSFFARGIKGELGRGGRYRTGVGNGGGEGEDATGFTLYTDTVLEAMAPHRPAPRVYVPAGSDAAAAARWRSQDYVTVAGLVPVADAVAEARRLGCSHVLSGEKIIGVE
ncbi:MAG TPA: ATP phosphoribosyltransferase regulatory subunit [Stellaceae bacterium]|nr:ATP phosphoribosyltransferase regulatory subunit [Stellaceae bacterium]